MATDIERVRMKIGDRPSLERKQAHGDGISDKYKMDHEPISNPEVWINGVGSLDFVSDDTNGVIIFNTTPLATDELEFQYTTSAWTDLEVQDFLDQYSQNSNLAAVHMLLAWAADAARLAKRETKSGGGGLGAITIDTSVAARELRNTAQALLDYEKEYGETIGTATPAEGLTEIPWTEAAYVDSVSQKLIRES